MVSYQSLRINLLMIESYFSMFFQVASGLVNMALGGDQGGSIRVPASWCGCVGLKPTWGLVPVTGSIG